MALNDPIADYLTRIRNAQQAGHRTVEIPASNVKKRITEILYENGYILKYTFAGDTPKEAVIKIALKYNPETKKPVIRNLRRVSKPGLRQFRKADELPRVINGLGIAIISTNKGLITNKEAREQNLGGEVICYVS